MNLLNKYKYKYIIPLLFLGLFSLFIFLRFYELSDRAVLGWDQADSAWAAKRLLKDSPILLQGVPIKGNAGMYLGPLYYYLVAPFYYFTNLDMIASPIFASVVSIISLLLITLITKNIFGSAVAFLTAYIYTITFGVIASDRLQAAYVLIPLLSYIIFYFLYKLLLGREIYVLYLAAAIGIGFHIHITTIFYGPIIILMSPFLPKTKRMLVYGIISLLILIIMLSPLIISLIFSKNNGSDGLIGYLSSSYHGFHIRRVLQLSHDAFISFQSVLQTDYLRPFVYFVYPLFSIVYGLSQSKQNLLIKALFIFMIGLWIIIPWLILSTYSGELTDYYFSLPRNLVYVMVAYICIRLCRLQNALFIAPVILTLIAYTTYNMYQFMHVPSGNYLGVIGTAKTMILSGEKMEFKDRDPLFYTYYIYSTYR